ncbi:Tryptophan synthase alpha chain [Minicystis rosea]|nr:Tryptophan synthase alpha chain [Minicystis rosea]
MSVALVGAAGCQLIFGVGDPVLLQGSGGSGGATTSSTGTAGSGGAMVCTPEKEEACYEGPSGTEGKGLCKGGTKTCDKDGAWGGCAGQVLPKAETCGSTEDEDCDGVDCVVWASAFDGDIDAMAATPDGGMVVAGHVNTAPAHLGKGTIPAAGSFVAKLQPDGAMVWMVPVGARVLTSDSAGNIYGAGNAEAGTMIGAKTLPLGQYVMKLGGDGSVSWVRSLGGLVGNDSFSINGGPTSIAASPDGDVVLAGVAAKAGIDLGDGSMTLIDGSATAYVAKLSGADGSGTTATSGQRWTLTVPAYKHGFFWYGPYVGVSSANVVSIVLNLTGSASIGGVALASGTIGLVTVSSMGDYYGSQSIAADGGQIALHGSSGPDGTVVVGGSFLGTIDLGLWVPGTMLVAKSTTPPFPNAADIYGDGFTIAMNGDSVRVAKAFQTAGHVTGVALDPSGGVMLAGTFSGVANLDGEMLDAGQGTAVLLAKLGPDGLLQWHRAFSHPSESSLDPKLAVTSDGSSWLGGSSAVWPLDLGAGPLNTSAKPNVGYLARYAP